MGEEARQRTVVVTNPQGLHARPAVLFAKRAREFESRIFVTRGIERVDAKSTLAILTLGVTQGTQLSIEAEGHDAEAALDALSELVASGFEGDNAGLQEDSGE